MEKQQMNNRTETCNMAAVALAIPLSIIAFALTKVKPKINIVNITESKTADEKDKPINNDQYEAKNRAINCFGTKRLLEKRRKRLRFWNKINKFIGLFIPVFLGYSFMSAKDLLPIIPMIMPIFPYIALVLNISILTISILSLAFEWDVKIENYTESISNNTLYYKIFNEILERYNDNPTEYAAKLKETILLDDIQQSKDDKENFSPSDYHFINRNGLHQLQAECPVCNRIPDLANIGTCNNCGK